MSSSMPITLLLPIIGSFLLLALLFWIWMLIDCLLHETDREDKRFKWSIGIGITNVIGATLYLFKRKLPRKKLA